MRDKREKAGATPVPLKPKGAAPLARPRWFVSTQPAGTRCGRGWCSKEPPIYDGACQGECKHYEEIAGAAPRRNKMLKEHAPKDAYSEGKGYSETPEEPS